MHFSTTLLALTGLTSLATAVDVKFIRFAQANCQAPSHIGKDTHLHNPHCKTFDKHEPAFMSYAVIPEGHIMDIPNKDCYVTVFEGKHCKGRGFTMDDLDKSAFQCGNATIPARSAKVTCEDRPSKKPKTTKKPKHFTSLMTSVSKKTFTKTVHVKPTQVVDTAKGFTYVPPRKTYMAARGVDEAEPLATVTMKTGGGVAVATIYPADAAPEVVEVRAEDVMDTAGAMVEDGEGYVANHPRPHLSAV